MYARLSPSFRTSPTVASLHCGASVAGPARTAQDVIYPSSDRQRVQSCDGLALDVAGVSVADVPVGVWLIALLAGLGAGLWAGSVFGLL